MFNRFIAFLAYFGLMFAIGCGSSTPSSITGSEYEQFLKEHPELNVIEDDDEYDDDDEGGD